MYFLNLKNFFFNKKNTPQCKKGMVKKLSSTRKMDPSARGGIVVDVVDSNLIVSDNFVKHVLLLLKALLKAFESHHSLLLLSLFFINQK